MIRQTLRTTLLAAAVLTLAAAAPAFGPPWISIETPPNPYDAASRGAFLLVHTFHHGDLTPSGVMRLDFQDVLARNPNGNAFHRCARKTSLSFRLKRATRYRRRNEHVPIEHIRQRGFRAITRRPPRALHSHRLPLHPT